MRRRLAKLEGTMRPPTQKSDVEFFALTQPLGKLHQNSGKKSGFPLSYLLSRAWIDRVGGQRLY
jgi:hypothetical protein